MLAPIAGAPGSPPSATLRPTGPQAWPAARTAPPGPAHLVAVSQEVVAQGELLVGRAELLAPRLHGTGGGLPQPPGHLPGGRQWLLVVSAQCELQECLEVGDDQRPEVLRAGEELVHHLEGGQADLGMLLAQLRHQQVVCVAQPLLRRPGDTGCPQQVPDACGHVS